MKEFLASSLAISYACFKNHSATSRTLVFSAAPWLWTVTMVTARSISYAGRAISDAVYDASIG